MNGIEAPPAPGARRSGAQLERALAAAALGIAAAALAGAAAGCRTAPPQRTAAPEQGWAAPHPIAPPAEAMAFLGADGQLWLADAEGEPQRVTRTGQVRDCAWSPDGSRLAYLDYRQVEAPARLVFYDPAAASRITSTFTLADDWDMSHLEAVEWSPNGRYLLLETGVGELRSLVVVEPQSGRLIQELGAVGHAWSPDGEQVALGQLEPLATPIDRGAGESYSLAVWSVGDEASTVVLRGTDRALYVPEAWLGDGRLLYAATTRDAGSEWVTERWLLALDSPDATPEPALGAPGVPTALDAIERLPEAIRSAATQGAASPDGRWLAYVAGPAPRAGVFLWDLAASAGPRRLGTGHDPKWRPAPAAAPSVPPTPESGG
jgi:WD40 repeat protein